MSQSINLNILPNYSQVSGLYFSQNDVGRTATINLVDDNGVPYEIPSGATVKIQATKPSGLGFSESCTYEDNIVTVTCSATMTDELGKFPCEIEILSGSVVLGTANFLFCVERNPHPNGTTDGTAESVLNDITVAFNNAMENIENAGGLTVDIKEALLACFRNVAWIGDDGQEYYDDLADALYAVTGITLNSNSLVFNSIGSTQQLTASLIPSGSVATIVWESSDTDVAIVSSTGLVTSVGDGEATITASVGSVSATCSVTVEELSVVSLSAVLNASGHTFYVGDNIDTIKPYLTLTATYSDSSTAVIPSGSYTLSGSLSTAGSNTITVSYEGVSTTVNVTAVAVELVSITCVYTQSGAVYNTDTLDSLKSDLVVTAHYDDSSSATVPSADYTLSGTLTVGTSTITVSYSGKTTTFTVTVTENELLSISAVYTQSGTVYETDSLDSLRSDLIVTAHYSDSTTSTITNYVLSGTLTAGTSTITVTYDSKTTTFNVTVYSSVLYSLGTPTTFNGTSDFIDTQIKLMNADSDFTVIFTATNGSVSALAPIFHCMTESSGYPGLACQMSGGFYGIGGTQGSLVMTECPSTSGTTNKIVIRHTLGTLNYLVDSATNGTRNAQIVISNNAFRSSDKNLLIGCYQTTNGTKGRYWNGTVNDFTIYSSVLSDDNVDEYLGGTING